MSSSTKVEQDSQQSSSTADLMSDSSSDEAVLTKFLIEHLLPRFSHSLCLQVLLVYQTDQERSRCLMINKKFERPCQTQRPEKEETTSNTSVLGDSGFSENQPPTSSLLNCIADNSICFSSPITESTPPPVLTSNSPTESSSSRRQKRKLSRPCKIPQDITNQQHLTISPDCQSTTSDHQSTPAKKPSNSCHLNDNQVIISSSTTTAPPPPNTSNPILLDLRSARQPGLSETLLLPITLLPRTAATGNMHPIALSTVLPTNQRPILPRTISTSSQLNKPIANRINLLSSITGTSFPRKATTSLDDSKRLDQNTPNSTRVSSPRRFIKSFLCNQCRKSFASLNQLCTHTFAVHRGFRCTICRAAFTQRSNLQRHSLKHVGFKPFICKVCDKAYYRKDHLVRHIDQSHPGCDPRTNLIARLSSAECLDYLDHVQQQGQGPSSGNGVSSSDLSSNEPPSTFQSSSFANNQPVVSQITPSSSSLQPDDQLQAF